MFRKANIQGQERKSVGSLLLLLGPGLTKWMVLGQRPSITPPVLIAFIPDDTPGPSAAVGDQEEQNEEASEPAERE